MGLAIYYIPYCIAYLNGEKELFFVKYSLKDKSEDSLEKIIKKYSNLIPKDSILITDKQHLKLSEITEKDQISLNLSCFHTLHFFSLEFMYKNIKKNTSFENIKNYELINFCQNFNIYKYPQKLDINNFYSIIIFGNEYDNKLFIDGFLNFLFEIKIDEKYRLQLEETKKDFIQTFYFQTKKGNFKFISINSSLKIAFSENEFKQTLELFKNEKINLFILNRIYDFERYEKFNTFFITKYLETKNENYKNCVFFVEPNIIPEYYLAEKIQKNEDFSRKDINLFYSKYLDIKSLFKDDSGRLNYCNYNLLMEGYKYFYEILIKREKRIIEFSGFKKYLNTYIENKKIEREIQLKKNEQKKLINEKINDKKEKIKEIEKTITNINGQINHILLLKKK